MMCQIRRPHLLAPLIELDELIRVHVVHGRRDVASGIVHLHRTRGVAVARNRVRSREIERAMLRIGAMDAGSRCAVRVGSCDRQRQLLRRDRPMSPHHPRGNAQFLLPEDVAGEYIGYAEDHAEDAGGDDDPPVGGAEGFLGGGFLVQVSEDGDADDAHEDAEGDEAMGGGEEGPGAGEVGAEEGGLGQDEEHYISR